MTAQPAWLPLAKAMTERDLQKAVTDLATARGWLWFHDNDSRRNRAGFPDLVLVRRGRLVCVELKAENGRLREEQWRWLSELGKVEGPETHVWKPTAWFNGSIAAVLA